MHDRNSYHGHRPTCKRDAAAPGHGQGEIKDLATPATCQERRKNKNKLTPAEIGRLPARSDPALKRDVAALESSGWFSRYQGCSRQKASLSLSLFLSLFLSVFLLFSSVFHSTLDPVAVLSSHPFVSLHFGLLSGGVETPPALLRLAAERSRGAGAPGPAEPARSDASGEVCFGEGGGSVSPRSALRISLPPSGTWKRYGLRKPLWHGTPGVRRGGSKKRAQGERLGRERSLNEPETTSVCLWKTQLWSDAIKYVDVCPRLLTRAPQGDPAPGQIRVRAALLSVLLRSVSIRFVDYCFRFFFSFLFCFFPPFFSSLVSFVFRFGFFPSFSFGVVDVLMCCGARLLAGVDNCFVFD